jgi:hypothetical protein
MQITAIRKDAVNLHNCFRSQSARNCHSEPHLLVANGPFDLFCLPFGHGQLTGQRTGNIQALGELDFQKLFPVQVANDCCLADVADEAPTARKLISKNILNHILLRNHTDSQLPIAHLVLLHFAESLIDRDFGIVQVTSPESHGKSHDFQNQLRHVRA